MGQAKNRGTREERIAQAIDAGREKRKPYKVTRAEYDPEMENALLMFAPIVFSAMARRRRRV